MARKGKPDMSKALQEQNEQEQTETQKSQHALVEPIPEAHNQRSPSRRGKRMAAVYLDPDDHRRLKILCAELDITMEEFLKDSINMKCHLHNKPPID